MAKNIPSAAKDFLTNEFVRRKRKNPHYSLRAFARDLGLNVASLSQTLAGKRDLSAQNKALVAEKLCLSPLEQSKLGNKTKRSATVFDPIAEDRFHLMSEWYYFAILSLARIRRNRADAWWVAKRLGISAIEARAALERLQRLGYIKITRGKLVRTAAPLTTTNDVPSAALRKFNKQFLELAAKSIDRDTVDKRQTVTMTMAINPKRIPDAKQMVLEFRNRLCDFLEEGAQNEVYSLAIQLFPLTLTETTP